MKKEKSAKPGLSVSEFTLGLQRLLFVVAEDAIPGMSARHHDLLSALDLIRGETLVPYVSCGAGRPLSSRSAMFRGFLAKAYWNIGSTTALRQALMLDEPLRLICGFPSRSSVPSLSTWSRAFAEFAQSKLGDLAHEKTILRLLGPDALVLEVYRDATDVRAREAPLVKPPKVKGPPRKRGPKPGKKEAEKVEPTRMERQKTQTLSQMMKELPTACDAGAKKNSHGHTQYWIGYKLHVDVTTHGFPLAAITTSASVHDSQVAIPLMKTSALRAACCYQLMDAGYVGKAIVEAAHDLGQVAIVAPRAAPGAEVVPLSKDRKARLKHRWQVEQFFSWIKERYGGRSVRVRGHAKVHFHLMCGVLSALTFAARQS